MAILKNERVRFKKRDRRKTKRENILERKKTMELVQHGEGLYIFRNRTGGSLILIKESADGQKTIGPGETWEGDDYFMQLVPREATVVKVLLSPEETRNKKMTEEKLILDQPDQVTQEGTVEHVVEAPAAPLNEEAPVEDNKNAEVLLTEDPMEGIEILND